MATVGSGYGIPATSSECVNRIIVRGLEDGVQYRISLELLDGRKCEYRKSLDGTARLASDVAKLVNGDSILLARLAGTEGSPGGLDLLANESCSAAKTSDHTFNAQDEP